MGFAPMAFLCVCVGVLGGLLGAAALLKLAVVLTNRSIGSVKEKARARSGIAEWDWDDWDDEDQYDQTAPVWTEPRKPAIPEPSVFKCVGILFITGFVSGLGFLLLGFAAEEMGLRMWREETKIAVAIVDLPVAFLALSVMLVATLPTTFWRAAMVAFFYGLLFIALTLCLGVGLFILRVLL